MKGIIDEADFIDNKDIDNAEKIIGKRLGELKKEGKIHICSTPPKYSSKLSWTTFKKKVKEIGFLNTLNEAVGVKK